MPIERTPDLAPPAQLELGWRLAAACSAAAFGPDEPTRAEQHGWFYDDGGGTSCGDHYKRVCRTGDREPSKQLVDAVGESGWSMRDLPGERCLSCSRYICSVYWGS